MEPDPAGQPFDREGVRGVLHTPGRPPEHALALTHGAGSDMEAPLMRNVARAFCDAGVLVLRYDLPFRVDRPTGPPNPAMAAADRAGIARAIAALRRRVPGRVFAGGHSYGGRQTAMLAAEQKRLADGLLLLSYPLHPPRKRSELRTAFFPHWRTPALFVHGSRDPFGSLEEMRAALVEIPAPVDLLPVEGAGHDLGGAASVAGVLPARMLF